MNSRTIFERLRALLTDPADLRAIHDLETVLQEEAIEAERRERAAEDEIKILRDLSGVREDQAKQRIFVQERELVRLRRESEELQAKMKAAARERYDALSENEKLRRNADLLSRQSSQSRGKWEWNIQELETEKNALSVEVRKMQERIQSLTQQLTDTSQYVQQRSEQEKRELESKLVGQLHNLLGEQRRQTLAEEQLLLRGLYTYIQNQVGGIAGFSQMLMDRALALHWGDSDPQSLRERLFGWPARIRRLFESQRKVAAELTVLEGIFRENAANLAKLEKGLSDFAGLTQPQALNPEPAHLAEILEKAITLRESLFKKQRITVNKQWAETPPVLVDCETVLAACGEILLNAVEAQPAGTIEAAVSAEPENGLVVLSVSDQGPGVPEHLVEKVFEPFFTSKPGHSGLGLTRARRLASLNNGLVELRSEGRGAELVFKFPAFVEPG